jgi:hypothetical protein
MGRSLRRGAGLLCAAITLAIVAPSAASADPFPLQAWWPMNEGSGQTVKDWSGHKVNGYLGSTPAVDANDPSWIKGVFLGSALRFDGGDMVTIPDSPYLEPAKITVSAWVRGTSSPGENKYVVSKGAYGCDHSSYGLYTGSTGGASFYIGDANGAWYRSPQADAAAVWDGKWHNVAGTYDGTTVRFFVDGNEVEHGTPAIAAIGYPMPTSDSGALGDFQGADGAGNVCNLYLVGDVDGVQIWSKALPIDDIWRSLRALLTAAR